MDAYDSPPSPLSATPTQPSRRSTTDKATTRKRRSKHHDHRSSSYILNNTDLAQLLISEEREARELRDAISTLTERLRVETTRADSAEQKLTSTLIKFKEVSGAKVAVQQDFNRVSEELRLYKLQLDNAQKEIHKAQDVIDVLEKERNDAEESAARARSTARKLKEEKLVMQAREDGRREGMQQGFERGRRLGFEEGRAAGYESGRAAALREFQDDREIPSRATPPRPVSHRSISLRQSLSQSRLRQSTTPVDLQEDIHIPSPPPSRPLTGAFAHVPIPEPVIVQNVHIPEPVIPINGQGDYLPDGWIPTIDEDERIRLPPPHELTTTPTTSPPAGVALRMDNSTPVLTIPPPSSPNDVNESHSHQPTPSYYTPPDASPIDSESSGKPRPRPRRRNSTESESTTISQFEILGPPIAPSARSVGGIERPESVLSAIKEESQRGSSGANSPNAPHSSPIGISGPEPYHIVSALNRSSVSQLEGLVYPRPGDGRDPQSSDSEPEQIGRGRMVSGSSQARSHLSPPSRSRSRQSVASSNGGYNIVVEPPSRPDSNQSQTSLTQGQAPNMLSAIDAEISLQLPLEPPSISDEPPQPSYVSSPVPNYGAPTPSLNPIPPSYPYTPSSNIVNELPPGFVPYGPPTPTPSLSNRQSQHAPSRPASVASGHRIYAEPMTPAAVPLPPSIVPSVHRLYTPAASHMSTPSMHPAQANGTVDPVVIPLPASTAGSYRSLPAGSRYSRSHVRRDSSSDDESTSSFDSLTTPPMRARKISSATSATTRAAAERRQSERGSVVGSASKAGRSTPAPEPSYVAAPIPPDVEYPRPPSVVGSVSPLPPSSHPQPSRTRSRSGSVLSTATSATTRAVKVPLPPSTVAGSPASIYTKVSRRGGSVVGRDR